MSDATEPGRTPRRLNCVPARSFVEYPDMAVRAQDRADLPSGRLTTAAVVLGVGFGGFFDGIVFHQILQWHHMLSSAAPPNTVANLQLNTLADGLFHGTTWVISLAGVWLLWRVNGERALPGSSRILLGGLVAGWGLFNVVEGLVDHVILGVHHVRPGADQAMYDVGFLVWGAAFLAVGWGLIRSARRAALGRGPRKVT